MERTTRRMIVLLAVAGVAAAVDPGAGASSLLTFENTFTANEQPLTSYGGLQWQNVQTMNTDWWVRDRDPINGYVNGAVSPPTVAWVPADSPLVNRATATISSMTPFALQSAALTSAWNDNLVLQVNAYLAGQIVGSRTLTLNPSGPTMVGFGFQRVDTVRLSASGGTPDPAFASPGLPSYAVMPSPQFVIDNVTVDGPGVIPPVSPAPVPVPEPSGLFVAVVLVACSRSCRKHE